MQVFGLDPIIFVESLDDNVKILLSEKEAPGLAKVLSILTQHERMKVLHAVHTGQPFSHYGIEEQTIRRECRLTLQQTMMLSGIVASISGKIGLL